MTSKNLLPPESWPISNQLSFKHPTGIMKSKFLYVKGYAVYKGGGDSKIVKHIVDFYLFKNYWTIKFERMKGLVCYFPREKY